MVHFFISFFRLQLASILSIPTLRNIIFDLGDVIIPIDLRAPIHNFAVLAGMTDDAVETLWKEHGLTQQYETGLIDDAAFRQHVRTLLQVHPAGGDPAATDQWADEVIDTAWNTVLLDLPVERIERIKALRSRYRLFLLSNTSPIHIRQVNQMLTALGQPTLDALFERVYYSFEVRLMKPSPAIYHHVLQTAGIVADETAFLDDNAANIAAATALGIRAVQVQPPLTILDYLND